MDDGKSKGPGVVGTDRAACELLRIAYKIAPRGMKEKVLETLRCMPEIVRTFRKSEYLEMKGYVCGFQDFRPGDTLVQVFLNHGSAACTTYFVLREHWESFYQRLEKEFPEAMVHSILES